MFSKSELQKRQKEVRKIQDDVKRRLGTLSSKKVRGVYRMKLEELSMKRLGSARVVQGGGTSPR